MNAWYPTGLEAMQQGDVDVLSDTITAALLSDAYTFSVAHEFADDLSGVLSTVTVTTPTVSGGEFFADDLVFSSVAIGDTAAAVVYYHNTGTPSTSTLLGFVDRKADTVPISIDTNDGDITFALVDGRVWKL